MLGTITPKFSSKYSPRNHEIPTQKHPEGTANSSKFLLKMEKFPVNYLSEENTLHPTIRIEYYTLFNVTHDPR